MSNYANLMFHLEEWDPDLLNKTKPGFIYNGVGVWRRASKPLLSIGERTCSLPLLGKFFEIGCTNL